MRRGRAEDREKNSAHSSCSAPEALEQALCYGWIDGRRNALDEDFRLTRAKTEQTGAERIAAFVAMFAEGKALH
jgi:uncharacterized protein YdeI (YjbR/CyaY-like superfamily)